MKKTFRLLLVLVVGVIITACSNETLKNENNSNLKDATENKKSYKDEQNTSDSLDVFTSTKANDNDISYEDRQIISESEENGIKTIKVFYSKDSPDLPTIYNVNNSYKGHLELDNAIFVTNGWIAAFSGKID